MYSALLPSPRKLLLVTSTLVLLCSLLIYPIAQVRSAASKQRDCDANAVLRCGAYTTAEVKQKYNSQAGAKTIFHHFGISSTEVNQMHGTAVSGYVTEGGRVLIKDKTVATGAQTAGRQNMPGSQAITRNGTSFYTRPPSVSFNQTKLDAYIVMKNGQFQYAVIKSCGNPVKANPVTQQQAKPQPAPTPVRPITTPQVPKPAQSPAPIPAPEKSQATQIQIVETNQIVLVEAPKTVPPKPVAPAPTPPAPAPAPIAPAILPKTGPGEVIGASAAIGMASTFGYGLYEWLRRRYGMV